MDYSVGELFVEEVPSELEKFEGDVIIREMGFKQSEISYMFVRKPLDIHTTDCNLFNIKKEREE